jgi:hypothetical protein
MRLFDRINMIYQDLQDVENQKHVDPEKSC